MTSEPDHRLGDIALTALGWTERQQRALDALSDANALPARIVRQEGAGSWVDTGSEQLPALLSGRFKYAAASAVDLPVVGDWVLIERRSNGASELGVIQSILARGSTLTRRRVGIKTDVQLLAANVDLGLIVWALDRAPNLKLLERAVALVEAAGIAPMIVLTKADSDAAWSEQLQVVRAQSAHPVLAVSVLSGQGLGELSSAIACGQTAALLGQSGAGKSSLVNHLLGDAVTRVGVVRLGDHKGRHTTTHRELFRIPGAGMIVDGPGIREFGLTGEDNVERKRRGDKRHAMGGGFAR